jgi:hypothetical protein
MANDKEMKEFRQEVWDLVTEYAEPDDKSNAFMVAGVLLATTLEIYVLTLGKEATIDVVEHAIEGVKEESYKMKLH